MAGYAPSGGAGATNRTRGTWSWVNVQTVTRPLRTTPNKSKGQNYDATCGRYYIGLQQESQFNRFRQCYATNVAYTLGQWGEQEDVKLFLKDKQRSTTRVAFTHAMVQPILTRLRGAADNISVSPIAEVATQFAKTRKEEDLARALAMSLASRGSDAVAAAFAPMGISPDEEQTRMFHENIYQDELVVAITSLMKMQDVKNRMSDMKRDIAKSVALSGLAAWHCSQVGEDLVWDLCEPDEVGWDPSAIRSDFADAEYVFTCPLMSVQAIAEKFQPKADDIQALDSWANTNSSGYNQNGWPQRQPRVFTVYYTDWIHVERGYVMDGDEMTFVTINEADPDSRDGEPTWTDDDLVDPPENEYTVDWTDSEWQNRKVRRWCQVTRYVSLIPWEYLPGAINGRVDGKDGEVTVKPYNERIKEADGRRLTSILSPTGDMILDSGICKLQETNPDHTYMKGFPLKFTTWAYVAGNVIAPLTAAISPQRVMNQITSDLMYRLRKAGHNSVAVDTDALAGSTMTEQEILFALKEGDPVNLKGALTGGLNNAVRDIDTSPGTSFYQAFSLIPQIKQMVESSVGVYEQNYGAPGSANQLVGTLQLQLQQAGVMQQPFFAAIADLYRQAHQFNAQAGKQFFTRRPWLLRQMVGDAGADTLELCKNLQNEQFRIRVDLTVNSAEMKTIADNQIIPMRMQMGLLDAQTAAELMGQSFPTDVDRASRRYVKQAALAAQQQAKQQEQQQMMMAMAQEQANIDQQEMELAKMENADKQTMEKIQGKLLQPAAQAESEWLKPPDPSKSTPL